MPETKVITSESVLYKGDISSLGVIIDDFGNISRVVDRKEIPGHLTVEDYGNAVIMPGLIDAHVHINEPGRTDWEGFETASHAAAAGGITTLVDMPLNSSPVTTTSEALAEKQEIAKEKSIVDCLFYGGLIPGNEEQIEPMIRAGAAGIKAFLCHSGINEFPNVTGNELSSAMSVLAQHNKPLLVHAELIALPDHEKPTDSKSYDQYLLSRPQQWEVDAINLVISLCRKTGCPVHIVHLSSAMALPALRNARSDELPVTVETAPHYLNFAAENIPDGDPRYKCAPPIREAANMELLKKALIEGDIDMVATDHSPCPPDLKNMESGDLITAWGGIASLQLLLPATWTALRNHNISSTNLARWLTERPAKLIGQSHRIGKIQEGMEANLIAWDPESKFTVNANDLHHRHKITPYEGMELYGSVKATWLRGEKIF